MLPAAAGTAHQHHYQHLPTGAESTQEQSDLSFGRRGCSFQGCWRERAPSNGGHCNYCLLPSPIKLPPMHRSFYKGIFFCIPAETPEEPHLPRPPGWAPGKEQAKSTLLTCVGVRDRWVAAVRQLIHLGHSARWPTHLNFHWSGVRNVALPLATRRRKGGANLESCVSFPTQFTPLPPSSLSPTPHF